MSAPLDLSAIDSWQFTSEGITYRVEITPDDVFPITEFDGCDAATIEAHGKGEWRFVNCVVIPLISGTDPNSMGRSTWTLEWGSVPVLNPDGTVTTTEKDRDYFMAHHVPDIADSVRANLKFLYAVLGGIFGE
jgi:hypothetical protein